ncbi:MAG: hypothetical protein CM15mP14_4190 [Rhodospirillaceae bacterium]|nr:MAG: hypothetical protein CM15mP14_4190 [Rhodospirillaceae bacterium]
MASNETENNPDYKFHADTYKGVCTLIQVSIVLIVITLLLLAGWLSDKLNDLARKVTSRLTLIIKLHYAAMWHFRYEFSELISIQPTISSSEKLRDFLCSGAAASEP